MEYRKNDIVTVQIEDIGNDGEGIGRIDGYALFVKDAVIGDVVEARITKVKKNYGYAKTEKVITPSSFRVEPRCPFHRQCGGCQIQAMNYERQLAFKQDKIKNHLIHIGGFDAEFVEKVVEPIVGMEKPWHYRNKAQYPVGYDKENNLITGFYAGRTHNIIPNTDCLLGAYENKQILETILTYMRENHVTAYREESGEGLVRHILIRTGFATGEILVCLVINGKKLPAEEELVRKLREIDLTQTGNGNKKEGYGKDREKARCRKDQEYGEKNNDAVKRIVSISASINTDKTNVIMGKEIRVLWGKEYMEDSIRIPAAEEKAQHKITFRISPLSFYQVNPVQTEKLYGLALDYAGLTGKETVWDLYCGIGTISLFLAKKAKQVYGVEIIPQAVWNAKENARLNGIANAEFYAGKVEEVLPKKYEQEGIYADVIVVDPPRKGCDGKCLETMLAMRAEKIVYISCDSATLARDLRVLADGGYEVKRVRGVDQFGGTVHVETVCLLSKLNVEHHIEVELNLDEMDLTTAESKAAYEEIKNYVLKHMGLKVSNLYIAQIKQKCGIIERANYNLSKSENSRQPKCPPEKEKAIIEALRHFRMI